MEPRAGRQQADRELEQHRRHGAHEQRAAERARQRRERERPRHSPADRPCLRIGVTAHEPRHDEGAHRRGDGRRHRIAGEIDEGGHDDDAADADTTDEQARDGAERDNRNELDKLHAQRAGVTTILPTTRSSCMQRMASVTLASATVLPMNGLTFPDSMSALNASIVSCLSGILKFLRFSGFSIVRASSHMKYGMPPTKRPPWRPGARPNCAWPIGT